MERIGRPQLGGAPITYLVSFFGHDELCEVLVPGLREKCSVTAIPTKWERLSERWNETIFVHCHRNLDQSIEVLLQPGSPPMWAWKVRYYGDPEFAGLYAT